MKSDRAMMRAEEFITFNPRLELKRGEAAARVSMDKLEPFTKRISGTEKGDYNGGVKFQNGDTVMARISPCLENGKTAFVDILKEGETAFGSTEFIVMRAKEGVGDPQYIYYLAVSPMFRGMAVKSMMGSSGRQRVQRGVLEKLELPLPPIEEQRRIGSFLAAIDSKIEINKRINNNLGQQARAVFAREFLSFKSLPGGWEKSSLAGIARYQNGPSMQKFPPAPGEPGLPVLRIRELRQGFCDDSSLRCSRAIGERYIVRDGDVIFSWSGSLLVDFWCGGVCGLNQHLFKVTSPSWDRWFYYAWTDYHLQRFAAAAADMATTMGHIRRGELAKAEVYIPPRDCYARIGALLEPMYDLIVSNRIENRRLARLRDTLLPGLLSGEIEVP